MLIIRKNQSNEFVVSASRNRTLQNANYLFEFTHILSREKVVFYPQLITQNNRYDKFRFTEGTTDNLSIVPPQVNFPYLGQYYYSIYQSSGSTLNPSLTQGEIETGRSVVIVDNDQEQDFFYQSFESNNENNQNIIFLSDKEESYIEPVVPTPTPSITPTSTSTPTPTPTMTPSPSPVILETEYQAVLNRSLELGFDTPGHTQRTKQNQLVKDLKNAGLWTKLSAFYMFRLDTSDGASPGFTFINWITPTNAICALERTVSSASFPTLTSDLGWTFNSLNRLRLGQNVSVSPNPILLTSTGNTQGVYYQQFIANSPSNANTIWSTNNNNWNRTRYNNTASHNVFRDVILTDPYDFRGLGFKATTIDGRPDTDTTIVFRNGGVSTNRTKTNVDIGIAGEAMKINGESPTNTHSWTCGLWFCGSNLKSDTDVPVLDTIITNYMNS
jgi:hypothetical protein